jgi:hypothetical protein
MEQAWSLDAVKIPFAHRPKKTRIRNCRGVDSTSLLCTQNIKHIQKKEAFSSKYKNTVALWIFLLRISKPFVQYNKSSFKQGAFSTLSPSNTMSTSLIVRENHERDAAFSQALHGQSAEQKSAFMAMLSKDSGAQQVAASAYFHHWDNKDATIEKKEDIEVRMTGRLKPLSTPS